MNAGGLGIPPPSGCSLLPQRWSCCLLSPLALSSGQEYGSSFRPGSLALLPPASPLYPRQPATLGFTSFWALKGLGASVVAAAWVPRGKVSGSGAGRPALSPPPPHPPSGRFPPSYPWRSGWRMLGQRR